MAKAFLHDDTSPLDYYLARSEGKTYNPYGRGGNIVQKVAHQKYVTQYNHQDGVKTKGDFIYDKLSEVPKARGFNDGKIFAGVPRLGYIFTSLYVIGSKSKILGMFQDAVGAPEMIVTTPLRIGVYKWKNILTASVYGVRISSGASKATAESKFVDTDVTQLLNLSGKEITIYPAILTQHIKNIFDGKMG